MIEQTKTQDELTQEQTETISVNEHIIHSLGNGTKDLNKWPVERF